MQELALKQPVWPVAGSDAPVRDHAAPHVPWAVVEQVTLLRQWDRGTEEARDFTSDAESVMRAVSVHGLEPTIVSPPPVSALGLDPREVIAMFIHAQSRLANGHAAVRREGRHRQPENPGCVPISHSRLDTAQS